MTTYINGMGTYIPVLALDKGADSNGNCSFRVSPTYLTFCPGFDVNASTIHVGRHAISVVQGTIRSSGSLQCRERAMGVKVSVGVKGSEGGSIGPLSSTHPF